MKASWTSGNGSIMRLAPVPIAYMNHPEQAVYFSIQSSRTTHASPLCLDACGWMASLLLALLHGGDKDCVLQVFYQPQTEAITTLQSFEFIDKNYRDLRGTGYVLESLESALWCFWHTHSYEDCILAAANLGDDADTTAAVAGQLAGAYYGFNGIRKDWREHLFWHDEIESLAQQLFELDPQLEELTSWRSDVTTTP